MRKRKIANGILYILLTVLFTWRIPWTESVRFNMNLMFMWFSVFAFGIYIASINLWIGLFLSYSIVNANMNPTPESAASLLAVILGSMLYVVFYHLFYKKAVETAFIVFALANLVLIIAQLSGFDVSMKLNTKIALSDQQLRMGILDNRNSLSAAFSLCLPVLFSWPLIYGIPFILAGFVFAHSVGGVLASMPVIFYYLYSFIGKKIILVSIISALLLVLYIKYVDPPNYKSRWAAWRMYAELRQAPYVLMNEDKKYRVIPQNHWFGIGLGHWKKVFGLIDIRSKRCHVCEKIGEWAGSDRQMYYKQAHSEPIQLDMEMGYIGIVIVLGFIVNVLRRVRHISDPRPVFQLLSIIIVSLVYFPFHNPFLAIGYLLCFVWLEKELPTSCSLRLSVFRFGLVSNALKKPFRQMKSIRRNIGQGPNTRKHK